MRYRRALTRTFTTLVFATATQAICAANSVLEHNAPYLGGTLELTLRGASPGAKITLYQSPDFGSTTTPWGTFELDRGLSSIVAVGTANAAGEWTYTAPVPSNPSLAETPQHFQAMVRPLNAPRELSNAAHLRWLGSRAYVACNGGEFPLGQFSDGELSIVSLTTNERITGVDFGAPVQTGQRNQPVFNANYSRGAVVVDSRVVVFDPYFGGVIGSQSFFGVDPLLYVGPDEATLYALVNPAPGALIRLQAIDLRTAQLTSSLDLPQGLWLNWAANASRTVAYVGSASDPNLTQSYVERIDLTTMQDLGATLVGVAGQSYLTAIAAQGDRILVATQDPPWLGGAFASTTRLIETINGPAQVVGQGVKSTHRLDSIPAFDVFAAEHTFNSVSFLRIERTNNPGTPLYLASTIYDVAPSSTGLWCASDPPFGILSGSWNMLHYEIATGTATWFPPQPWPYFPPSAIREVDDAQGRRLCVLFDGEDNLPFGLRPPQIYVHSPVGAFLTSVPVGAHPASMTVVAAP